MHQKGISPNVVWDALNKRPKFNLKILTVERAAEVEHMTFHLTFETLKPFK